MKNMQRIILAFLLLFAIISILMVTRRMKAASTHDASVKVASAIQTLYRGSDSARRGEARNQHFSRLG